MYVALTLRRFADLNSITNAWYKSTCVFCCALHTSSSFAPRVIERSGAGAAPFSPFLGGSLMSARGVAGVKRSRMTSCMSYFSSSLAFPMFKHVSSKDLPMLAKILTWFLFPVNLRSNCSCLPRNALIKVLALNNACDAFLDLAPIHFIRLCNDSFGATERLHFRRTIFTVTYKC